MSVMQKRSVGTKQKVTMALAGAGSIASFIWLPGLLYLNVIIGIALIGVVGWQFWELMKEYAKVGRRF